MRYAGQTHSEMWRVVISGTTPVPDTIVRASARHGICFEVSQDPSCVTGAVDAIVIRADAVWFAAVETAGRLSEHVELPVVLWVNEPSVACRVAAYDRGVADVCAATIDPVEFVVRVRSAVRRSTRRVSPATVTLATARGPLVVTPARLQAENSDGLVKLTALQWRLLSYLLTQHGIVQSHAALIRAVWGCSDDPSARHALRTHISALRRILRLDARVLRSVHGYGYVLGEQTET
ncbi:MAG: winged helix-turn-helix domain-containing protein [Nitriliruptoraceae bacterium]